ncbi:SDR family oxidoreductase [Ilyobacter sp.]|uniref:SDR family oxidoreductase n=1 Tax=Ilyobacter sp. TaxID=3100343 RepID=UPI0035654A4D
MSQTILITGASSGIGKTTAKFFQEKGWNVIATMRSPEKEEELNKLENVLVTRLDVTDSKSIDTAVSEGIDKFGKIDALLNNAGYGAIGIFEAFSMEQIRRQYDVNVIGLFETTKKILPHFRKNKSGVILNISSVGGRVAFPVTSLYHGTKYAIEGFTESLYYEMKAIGVKVKLIEPGFIKTDFAGRSLDFTNDESMEEYQALIKNAMGNLQVDKASEPIVVAEAIYQATTDGTSKLRYPIGGLAPEMIERREALNDDEFMTETEKNLGL